MYHSNYIQSIEFSVTAITLPNWTCNDEDFTVFDFSRYTNLESLNIGNDSFSYVQTFKIDGMIQLKTLIIGQNSFTQVKSGPTNYYSFSNKSFHILNCESLESIQIGKYSFQDFAGVFELNNLPQLQSIQIGTVGSKSCNFEQCSLVIQGMENSTEQVMCRTSISAIHYIG